MNTISKTDLYKHGGYFIEIGGKQKLFTLRHYSPMGRWIDGIGYLPEDCHIRNLAKSWDASWSLLDTILTKDDPFCLDHSTSFRGDLDANDHLGYGSHEIGECDRLWFHTVPVTFGKYCGKTVDEIDQIDHEYLVYIARSGSVTSSDFRSQQFRYIQSRFQLDVKKEIAQENAIKAISQYVGEIGVRQEFTVTIKKVITGEGYYGTWVLTISEDADGNVITYFNRIGYEGDKVTFKATIKDHKERDGQKQTVVSRAKLVEAK